MFINMRTQDADILITGQTVRAIIELLGNGSTVTNDAVTDLVTKYKADAIKERLDSDVKDGSLVSLDVVEDVNNVVSFKNEDTVFGAVEINSLAVYNSPDQNKEDASNSTEFIGKKVGDVVRGYEILGIYQMKSLEDSPNDQSK
jgi:hypothetical protein